MTDPVFAVWQISGGPASRAYAEVFLRHGVALIALGQKSRASPLAAMQTNPSRVHLLRWLYLVVLSRKPSRSQPAQ